MEIVIVIPSSFKKASHNQKRPNVFRKSRLKTCFQVNETFMYNQNIWKRLCHPLRKHKGAVRAPAHSSVNYHLARSSSSLNFLRWLSSTSTTTKTSILSKVPLLWLTHRQQGYNVLWESKQTKSA